MTGRWMILLVVGALACERPSGRTTQDLQAACTMPAQTTTVVERNGAILETWALRLQDVATNELPKDSAFLTYRAAIERDSANVLRPVADPPVARTDAEAEMWRNERFNNDLVFGGTVGSINSISCLDALLFSRQAGRISQIDH